MMIIIIISSSLILIKEYKFENTYIKDSTINTKGIVKSQINEKEYNNEFIIEITDKGKKINKTRLLVSDSSKTKLEYGDIVEISGEYRNIRSYKNNGVFNYEESLKKKNIYGNLKSNKIYKIGKSKSIYKFFVIINEKIKEKFDKNFSQNTSSILKGIVIGDKNDIDDKIIENIQDNGLSHLLAISGMHVGCLTLLVKTVLDQISCNYRKKKIILIVILIFFILLTGFIASALRAIVMSILVIVSRLVFRKNNFIVDISISSLIILIYNPYYLIDSGFLLSFGATIGIIYLYPILNKFKFKSKILTYVLSTFLISIAVNIFILPIMITSFKRISLSIFIMGIFITPIMFIIEIMGIFSILIPTAILVYIKVFVEIIVSLFLILSKINLGEIYLKVPNILEIIIYYLIIIYLIHKRSRKLIKTFLLVCIIILLITIGINITRKELKLYFVDVGQGDCTLIQTEEKINILIDSGGSEDYDIGKNVLIPYLLNKKINKIDYLMISHFDSDHAKGSIEVLKKLKVKNLIISSQLEKTNNLNEILEIARKKNIHIIICKKGDIINTSQTTKFEIIWPKEKLEAKDINNNSIVAKFVYNNTKILFTGDIEQETEEQLVNNDLKAEILKIPHHGSKTSSTDKFLNKVKAKICLIGVGEYNNFGHPASIVLQRLKNYGTKIYRTDEDGEITIIIKKDGNTLIDTYKGIAINNR